MRPGRRRTAPELALPSAQPRGFDRVLRWSLLALAIGCGVWVAPRLPDAWRWITGKPAKFRPEHPVGLAEVDLPALCGEHWTAWIVAAAQTTPGVDAEPLVSARSTMRNAVSGDRNLLELFDELDAIVTSPKLGTESGQRRALWLVGAWNDYLDTNAQPFFFHGNVLLQRPHPIFYAHAYQVVADAHGTVGEARVRVRSLSRLDRTNLRETYLGYVSNEEEGALLLVDRVGEDALDRVWPLLAGSEGADRESGRFADVVLAEAERELPADVLGELVATARLRRAAIAAMDGMEERSGCSGLWFRKMPWNGYDQDMLSDLAGAVEGGRCARVHPDEFTALREASEAFQARPELERALEHLVAWAARPVVVHELRHVGDDLARDDDDGPRKCGICTVTDPDPVRAEVAAYIAQLAWSSTPALALHQMCVTTEDDPDEQTVHGRARAVVLTGLGWSCREGVPDDLATRAQRIEAEAFDRSETIALGDDLPARLAVVSARERAVDAAPKP